MINTYEYNVVRQAQAYQLPSLEEPSWKDGTQRVCFKMSMCVDLIVSNNKIYLRSVGDITLKGEPGDYLVFQHGELFFVKKKVFELKYKKIEL
jgi:hypothetical protein